MMRTSDCGSESEPRADILNIGRLIMVVQAESKGEGVLNMIRARPV